MKSKTKYPVAFLALLLFLLPLSLSACSSAQIEETGVQSGAYASVMDDELEEPFTQPHHDVLSLRADAYTTALVSIYGLDPGLNGDIDFIAVDPTSMKDASADELYQIRSLLAHETGVSVELMTMEQLQEQGHYDAESHQLKDCVLLSFDEVTYTPEQLTLQGHKYRSGLGAIWTDTVVVNREDGWKIEKSEITAIS